MATLYFKVSSDWQEVVRLRQECEKLESQLKKMDSRTAPAATKALETQLASTKQQMMGLVTEAAKAGATMGNDLKRKINSVTKASDELSEEIIKQRKIIRDTQDDVRRLSEQYSKMGKFDPKAKSTLNQLNRAKTALNEQKYALGDLQDQQARNKLELRQLTREYRNFSQGTDKATATVDALMSSLKRTAVEIGGLAVIKKFGSDVINATGTMQQLHVALSTILQDGGKASMLIGEITQFAAKTQFNLEDVASGAKQLLAYGSSAETVVDELSMLGDVAAGLQIPIGQLIYLYGTLRTQGRAMTVDIRQFAGRGIPIYEELAKVLGVTKDQVGELVTAGKVGFKEVEQAFKNMTSEGGKFNNMLENSAGTWPQRISNIEDVLFQKLNDFGNKYKEVFEFGIGTAEELVEHLDDVISVIGGLVAAYGTYKAALIATAVAQKAVGFVESIRLIMSYRKQLGLATAAQQAFNVAAKSNVYVALLSVLVGLGTAIYMFTKRTKEATAAQEVLSKVNKKADEEFLTQAATIDRLNGVLKSETASLDQKKKALGELQSIIPDYNASLNKEGELINNNTEAIKNYLEQLEKQIRLKAAQEELEELYRKKRQLEKQKETATQDYSDARLLYNASNMTTNIGLQNKNINTGVAVFARSNVANNQFADRVNKAKKALDNINAALGETTEGIAALRTEIEQGSTPSTSNTSQSSIFKEIENATDKIKKLKQEIIDLRSGKLKAGAGKTVESAIKAKTQELQALEETLETLTGSKPQTTKEENATNSQQDKIFELEQKQAQLRIRQQIDLENRVTQARIDAMADGAEKERAQRELDNKKELQAIERQKQDYIRSVIQAQKEIFDAQENLKAKQTPNYKKKSFDSSSVSVDTSMFDIIYDSTRKRQVNDQIREQELNWNEYLQKYGTFQQKRKAIIEKYDKEIAEAQTAGDIAIKTEEKKAALEALDEQYGKSTRAMADLFEDASEKSVSSIQKIIDKYETLVKYLSGTKQSDNTSVTKDDLKSIGFTDKDIEKIERGEISIRDVTDAIKGLKEELEGKSPWQSFVFDMQKGIDKLRTAKGDSDKIGEGITNIGNAVAEFSPSFGEFANNIASIFGIEDSNITEIANAIGGLAQTASGVGQIMSGDIVGGVMSGIGGISSIVSAFTAMHDKKNERQIERLQDQIDTLSDSYDDLGRSIEEAYSKSASGLIEEQNKLLEQQKILIEQQIREEEDKKKTDDDRIKEWRKQIEEINQTIENNKEAAIDAIFGEDVQSALDRFVDAWSDAWSNNEDRADAARNSVKQIMQQMVTESIKDMIKSSGKMEEIRDKLKQFYADNVLTGWEQDYIYDMAEQLQKELDSQFGWAGGLFQDKDEQQQQASAGYSVSASQDSVDVLSGRLLAVYESELRMEKHGEGIRNIADEVRSIIAQSYIELQEINENTGNSAKYLKEIKADIAVVKQNTSKL